MLSKLTQLEGTILCKLDKMWSNCSRDALAALSKTTNRNFEIKSSLIQIMPLGEVSSMLNPKESENIIFWMQLIGEIKGVILINSSISNIYKNG